MAEAMYAPSATSPHHIRSHRTTRQLRHTLAVLSLLTPEVGRSKDRVHMASNLAGVDNGVETRHGDGVLRAHDPDGSVVAIALEETGRGRDGATTGSRRSHGPRREGRGRNGEKEEEDSEHVNECGTPRRRGGCWGALQTTSVKLHYYGEEARSQPASSLLYSAVFECLNKDDKVGTDTVALWALRA